MQLERSDSLYLSALPDRASAVQRPARVVAADFAAELMRAAFAPLATSLGFYGDIALGSMSRSVALRETGGFTDELERIVERAR